jgi:DNA primase
VIFPIADFRGRVIAFGGRALSPDVPAKYLNSPETELFHKRSVLYNGRDARRAAREGVPVIVVEGYLDVVAAVGAGFEGTVAPLGTALTEEHLQILWRMADIPVLCFDGDDAGQRAAERVVDLVLPQLAPGKSVLIAHLPQGQDPDDLIKAEGRVGLQRVLDGAAPLSETVFALETRGQMLETPEARAALEGRLRERANAIRDATVRRHYSQAFIEKLNGMFRPQWQRRDAGRQGGSPGRRGRSQGPGQSGTGSPRLTISETLRNSRLLKPGHSADATPREAVILLCLINHPELAETRLEMLAELDLETRQAKTVLSAVLDLVTAGKMADGKAMRAALEANGHGLAVVRMEKLLAEQNIWQSGADIAEQDAETGLKHALALHNKRVQLNKELRAAEQAFGEDANAENLERLNDIRNQITSVDGTEALIEGFGSLSGRATRSF